MCTAHRVRGNVLCTNSFSAHKDELENVLLTQLSREVLTPDVLAAVIQRAIELHVQRQDADTERQTFERELRGVETELARYADAIGAGDPLPTLLEAMRVRERRRADLKARLEHLDGLTLAASSWTAEGYAPSSARA